LALVYRADDFERLFNDFLFRDFLFFFLGDTGFAPGPERGGRIDEPGAVIGAMPNAIFPPFV